MKPVVTIQKTAKDIKAALVISIFIMAAGIVGMMIGNPVSEAVGLVIFLGGAVMNLAGKLARWWNHD